MKLDLTVRRRKGRGADAGKTPGESSVTGIRSIQENVASAHVVSKDDFVAVADTKIEAKLLRLRSQFKVGDDLVRVGCWLKFAKADGALEFSRNTWNQRAAQFLISLYRLLSDPVS